MQAKGRYSKPTISAVALRSMLYQGKGRVPRQREVRSIATVAHHFVYVMGLQRVGAGAGATRLKSQA